MSYEWDVFVSYRRDSLVANWTQKLFVPKLREWLPHYHQPSPRVFLDVDSAQGIQIGSPWPSSLKTALLRSRCSVVILSPEYFTSNWCMAEFHTMLERQKAVKTSLLIPVRFSDGIYYSAEAQQLQQFMGLEPYNALARPSQANRSPGFVKQIKAVCALAHAQIDAAPAWDPGWLVVEPAAVAAPDLEKPVF
jgi:hypothetical protein